MDTNRNVRNDPISTGYRALDDVMGGLLPGGVTLIAARPAMGGFGLVLNMVSRLSRQLSGNILIISPRFGPNGVTIRLLNIGMELEAGKMLDGSLSAAEMADKCAQFFNSQKSYIKVEMITYPGMESIRWHCDRIPDLKLLVIDGMERIEERLDTASGVLRQLKELACELDVPVVCTTKLHRSLERRKNKRPRLTDLKKINISAELVDQVIFMYRDRYYDPEGDDSAECIVAKSSLGETGTVMLMFDDDTGSFREIP